MYSPDLVKFPCNRVYGQKAREETKHRDRDQERAYDPVKSESDTSASASPRFESIRSHRWRVIPFHFALESSLGHPLEYMLLATCLKGP